MLDSVKPQSIGICFAKIPLQPALELAVDIRVIDIDIHSHQVVKIAIFRICIRLPVTAGKTVYPALLMRRLIPVRACETIVIPDEIAVFSLSSRESEA